MLPRPFQAELLDAARDAMRRGARRVLFQLPTGGGKTFVAALMHKEMAERDRLSYFLAHRKELLGQTSATFDKVGLEHGFIARGRPVDPSKQTQLLGLSYAARRIADLPIPFAATFDEAHHAAASEWVALMEAWDCWQFGLSATPARLDGRGLGDRFDVMVKGPTPRWLIDNKFLSDFRYFAPGKPDLSGVRTTGGDWNKADLSDVMGDAALIGDVVRHYREICDGEQGIIFAVDRNHSSMIAKAFQAAGIAAAHIDGTMTDDQRDKIVSAFRAGIIKILCNVELFGEGFDVPNIVYCGICRPTKSLSWFLQMVGRALRTFDGKECAYIVDHAGNVFTHGLPDDERQWTLDAPARKQRGPSDAMSIHQCPLCYQVTPSQARLCPCGYVFTIRERSIAWAEGQLFELSRDERRQTEVIDAKAIRKAEERACETFDQLYDLAIRRGYGSPQGWAKQQLQMRKGKRPSGRRWGAR